MKPLDLSAQPPRSPYAQLAGLYMLPRTIDKMRAELPGGVQGTFHFSGFSETLLEELHIAHDDLLKIVEKAETDEDISAWVIANTETTGFQMINAKLLARCLDETNRERLTQKYPVLLEKPEIVRMFDMLDADDKANFPESG